MDWWLARQQLKRVFSDFASNVLVILLALGSFLLCLHLGCYFFGNTFGILAALIFWGSFAKAVIDNS